MKRFDKLSKQDKLRICKSESTPRLVIQPWMERDYDPQFYTHPLLVIDDVIVYGWELYSRDGVHVQFGKGGEPIPVESLDSCFLHGPVLNELIRCLSVHWLRYRERKLYELHASARPPTDTDIQAFANSIRIA